MLSGYRLFQISQWMSGRLKGLAEGAATLAQLKDLRGKIGGKWHRPPR